MSIVIDLTPEQDAAIEPLRKRLIEMNKEAPAGTAGMLLAQIYNGEMIVGVMPPDRAVKICNVLGTPQVLHQRIDERATGVPRIAQ